MALSRSMNSRRFLGGSDCVRGPHFIVGVHQQGDHRGLGNQLAKQLEPLGKQLEREFAEPGNVAARPGETGDEARFDRVADAGKDDRDRRGCIFRR